MRTLERDELEHAVIVGADCVGLETAEALITRGLHVTQVEQLSEVLPTVDPELGALVHAALERHGVEVAANTRVQAIAKAPAEARSRATKRRRIAMARGDRASAGPADGRR